MITTLDHFSLLQARTGSVSVYFLFKLSTNYIDKIMEIQLQMLCYFLRTAHDKTETISGNVKS